MPARVLLMAIIVTSTINAYGQTAHESVIRLTKKYAPFLGNEGSNLAIDFVRSFSLVDKKADTTYSIVMSVRQQVAAVEGYSLGLSLFGLGGETGGSAGLGINYRYLQETGSIIMNYDEFIKVYNATSELYRYISTLATLFKPKNSSYAEYSIRDITVAGEYRGQIEPKSLFYFKLGDANFKMTESEFKNIVKVIRDIKDRWDSLEQRV